MKAYRRAAVPLHSFLTLALDEVEWLTSLPSRISSGKADVESQVCDRNKVLAPYSAEIPARDP
jgi:hypothetical protein